MYANLKRLRRLGIMTPKNLLVGFLFLLKITSLSKSLLRRGYDILPNPKILKNNTVKVKVAHGSRQNFSSTTRRVAESIQHAVKLQCIHNFCCDYSTNRSVAPKFRESREGNDTIYDILFIFVSSLFN